MSSNNYIDIDEVSHRVIGNIMDKYEFEDIDKQKFLSMVRNIINNNFITHDMTVFIDKYFDEKNE